MEDHILWFNNMKTNVNPMQRIRDAVQNNAHNEFTMNTYKDIDFRLIYNGIGSTKPFTISRRDDYPFDGRVELSANQK